MSELKIHNIEDKNIWDDWVIKQNPGSFLHSWNWGETNKLLGKKIIRFGIYSGKLLKGVCLMIKETAKRGSYFVIPGGPILDWRNQKLVEIVFREIKNIAISEKVLFVRIRPDLYDSNENRELLNNLGLNVAPMHLHAENTWILDLDKSEEELLAGMRKTTRYLVKKSLNQNLIFVDSKNINDFKILAVLQNQTVARHKFVGFSSLIFKHQLETFAKDDQAKLFIVRKGNINLAAAIIIFYNDTAYYHHSGSASKMEKIPFSYFLQWKVIQEAKKRGIKYYNFWGIAPENKKNHRFAGVTLFKTGFGGRRVDWIPAHDLKIDNLYYINYVFELLRKKYRHL